MSVNSFLLVLFLAVCLVSLSRSSPLGAAPRPGNVTGSSLEMKPEETNKDSNSHEAADKTGGSLEQDRSVSNSTITDDEKEEENDTNETINETGLNLEQGKENDLLGDEHGRSESNRTITGDEKENEQTDTGHLTGRPHEQFASEDEPVKAEEENDSNEAINETGRNLEPGKENDILGDENGRSESNRTIADEEKEEENDSNETGRNLEQGKENDLLDDENGRSDSNRNNTVDEKENVQSAPRRATRWPFDPIASEDESVKAEEENDTNETGRNLEPGKENDILGDENGRSDSNRNNTDDEEKNVQNAPRRTTRWPGEPIASEDESAMAENDNFPDGDQHDTELLSEKKVDVSPQKSLNVHPPIDDKPEKNKDELLYGSEHSMPDPEEHASKQNDRSDTDTGDEKGNGIPEAVSKTGRNLDGHDFWEDKKDRDRVIGGEHDWIWQEEMKKNKKNDHKEDVFPPKRFTFLPPIEDKPENNNDRKIYGGEHDWIWREEIKKNKKDNDKEDVPPQKRFTFLPPIDDEPENNSDESISNDWDHNKEKDYDQEKDYDKESDEYLYSGEDDWDSMDQIPDPDFASKLGHEHSHSQEMTNFEYDKEFNFDLRLTLARRPYRSHQGNPTARYVCPDVFWTCNDEDGKILASLCMPHAFFRFQCKPRHTVEEAERVCTRHYPTTRFLEETKKPCGNAARRPWGIPTFWDKNENRPIEVYPG